MHIVPQCNNPIVTLKMIKVEFSRRLGQVNRTQAQRPFCLYSDLSPDGYITMLDRTLSCRISGVADHYAEDDEEAIATTRSIIANLGTTIRSTSASSADTLTSTSRSRYFVRPFETIVYSKMFLVLRPFPLVKRAKSMPTQTAQSSRPVSEHPIDTTRPFAVRYSKNKNSRSSCYVPQVKCAPVNGARFAEHVNYHESPINPPSGFATARFL